MEILSQLKRAIELRKPISFEYDVQNKVKGLRFGHPHAIFLHPTTDNMMIHIFQMEGVSDSKDKLPGWRQPLIDHLTSVAIFIKRIKSAIIVIAVKDSHWPTQKYIRYQTSTNFQQFTTRENTLISQQTEW